MIAPGLFISLVLAALALLTVVSMSWAGVQSSRLASANTKVERLTNENSALATRIDVVEREARVVQDVLAGERARAIAFERLAGRLREQIARDAGTDRDGTTAPVLQDTIRGLREGDRS